MDIGGNMKEVVYKVVRSTPEDGKFESLYAPTIHLDTGECIAQPLTYEFGEWTHKLPNSLGIFVYLNKEDTIKLCKELSNYSWTRIYVLECQRKGTPKQPWLICKYEEGNLIIPHSLWPEFCEKTYLPHPSKVEEYFKLLNKFKVFCTWVNTWGAYTVKAVYPIRIVYPIELED